MIRSCLIALFLLALPAAATAAIADAGNAATCDASASTTCSISITLTVGRGVVVLSGHTNGVTLSSCSDGANSYTLISTSGSGFALVSGCYLCNVTSGGAKTLTLTYSGEVYGGAAAREVTGQDTGSCLDQNGAANEQTDPGTATDAVTASAITTTTNDQYVFCISQESSFTGNAPAAGTGWTAGTTQGATPGYPSRAEYQIKATAGSITGTFTAGGASEDFLSKCVSFKSGGGGGGGGGGGIVERYVNTASGGGDGTTNGTGTGGNNAYASCAAWTAAEATNLVSVNTVHKVHFQGTAADTASCALIGWTTSDTNYIWMIVDPGVRHAGVWSTSSYRLEPTTDVSSLYLFSGANHVRIEGLQIGGSGTDADNVMIQIIQEATLDVRISHSIIRSTRSGANQTGILITTDPTGGNVRIWNSILYGFSTTGSFGILMYDGSVVLDLYNVTVANSDKGVNLDSGFATPQARLRNVLFYNNGSDALGTFLAGTDYNAADSGSIGYTVTGFGNTHDRVSQTFTFVNAGAGDFHLQSGDGGAKNFGLTDPSGGLFSDDIDLVSRSGSWDIGADEETGAGGGGTGTTSRILSGFIGR